MQLQIVWDLGEVFEKVIQESFSYALAQAFSGMEMSDDDILMI